jgi:small subunit ribosomal protein S8e
LVKNAVVTIDATPFAQWYGNHYGVNLNNKKGKEVAIETRKSKRAQDRVEERKKAQTIETKLVDQFSTQRLLAVINSRPGQSGRADGYILEGKEL